MIDRRASVPDEDCSLILLKAFQSQSEKSFSSLFLFEVKTLNKIEAWKLLEARASVSGEDSGEIHIKCFSVSI